MSDLQYHAMPFRSFPASWAPHIAHMLDSISSLLSAQQRAAFHLLELREHDGELLVCWTLLGDCEPLADDLDEAIDVIVEATQQQVKAL